MMDSSTALRIWKSSSLDEILDELCLRFIVYLPDKELESPERICFAIQDAHWFYEDFVREANSSLPTLALRSFISQVWRRIPETIQTHVPLWQAEEAFASFMMYKTRIDVRGVIMLNMAMNRCVLVKGWKSGASWSFPRGKIDEDEDDRLCAIRETVEETGVDVAGMVTEDDFLEIVQRGQNIRLYIAPGMSEDTHFVPQTRKEISKIEWFNLTDLPGYKSGRKPQTGKNGNGHVSQVEGERNDKFYMVAPFVGRLRKWIATKGKQWAKSQRRSLNPALNAVNPIEDETEVEADDPSPPAVVQDSAAGLKNLLGVQDAAEVVEHGQMNAAQQEEASRRLREMLRLSEPAPPPGGNSSGGLPLLNGNATTNGQSGQAGSFQPTNPNAQTLLDILNKGPAARAPSPPPPHPAMSQQKPPPQQPFSGANLPGQTARAQRTPLAPVFPNSPAHPQMMHMPGHGFPLQAHLPPNLQLNSVGQMDHHLPSPPATATYGFPLAPAAMNRPQFPQQPQHQHRSSAPAIAQTNFMFPPQPHMFPPPQNFIHNVPPTQRPPLTPIDSYVPSAPVPTRPPDPGQTGTLLSILKGGSTEQTPMQPPQVSQALQASPLPPPGSTHLPGPPGPPPPGHPQQLAGHHQPAPPAHPQPPITLHPPPPPRGPRNRTSHVPRSPSGSAPRPSTSAPPRHVFPPPGQPGPRAGLHGHAKRPSPPPAAPRTKTPVNIDPYTKHAAPTRNPAFDRRNSVSSEQAQTLLSMFRPTSVTPVPTTPTTTTTAVAAAPVSVPATQALVTMATGLGPGMVMNQIPPSPAFDRRNSVSNGHREALLNMFRSTSVAPSSPLASSPEVENVKPVKGGIALGNGTAVAGAAPTAAAAGVVTKVKGKSTAGKDKAWLMAQLMDVAGMAK